MKKFYLIIITVFFSCTQPLAIESELPRIKMVSTFDIALDKSKQNDLELQFDKVLNPQNLDTWMKHMSSKPHHVGSPWSKQNAEYAANKFKEWGFESAVETVSYTHLTLTTKA